MRPLLALIIALCLSLPVAAQEIVLVRHAEKSIEADPVLTPDGQARAQILADLLRDTPPVMILTSPARRTRDTAAPIVLAVGVVAEAVPIPPGNLPAHISLLVEKVSVLKPGQVALVVGHSNTVPAVIRALGGPPIPDLPECAYDRLFRWDVAEKRLRIERYGRESACPE